MNKHLVTAERMCQLLNNEFERGYSLAKFKYKTQNGEWIPRTVIFPTGKMQYYKCSNCDTDNLWSVKTNFCPNCGADMRGEEQ